MRKNLLFDDYFNLINEKLGEPKNDFLGWNFQKNVQKYIDENFYGEQPVGTSFYIKTGIDGLGLIHTPTMRVPSLINNSQVIYSA